ncbi:unnamed protein product [Brassica rapa subsp. narinosa]
MALSVSNRKGETTNPRFDFSASSIFGSFTIQTNRASSCSSFILLSWVVFELFGKFIFLRNVLCVFFCREKDMLVEHRRERIVASRSDYSADHNDLCDDKMMLKMQREQRKRADKENRERRGRVFWTTEKPIKITCTIFQRKKKNLREERKVLKQFFERCESIGIASSDVFNNRKASYRNRSY